MLHYNLVAQGQGNDYMSSISISISSIWYFMYTTGGSTVPAAIIGQILGGLIPKWGRFKVRGLIV